jgi:hypothetical protein
MAPWTVQVVFTAVRLNLFTILAERMMSVEEIASRCGAISNRLEPLLNACASMGLVVLEEGKYFNSHFSRMHLVEGEPRYVGDFIKHQHDIAHKWDGLLTAVVDKTSAESDQATDVALHKTFIKAMNNLGMLGEAEALRDVVDLDGCQEMVDVGGGSGLYSVILCQKHPRLRSTILDRRETLSIAKEMIAGYKEAKRITLREADYTRDDFGEEVDVVLLSDVIYDESKAAPVLKKAWNCLRGKGTLLVRGYYSDPAKSNPLFEALFVLNMLLFDPESRTMTISSLEKQMCEVGFTITRVARLTERSTLMVARK